VKIRILKIAVSAISILACVLLVALRVRSRRNTDVVRLTLSTNITLSSASGVIGVSTKIDGMPKWGWATIEVMPGPVQSWYFRSRPDGMSLHFPHRLPIAIFILLAAAPWVHWRFSLRTMLLGVLLYG
jgi:hypothetical protein